VSLIPDEILEQVKDATDIVSLVSESVELKRTGADWRGPCPFHGGTHRNFAVIPRKGLFYCYVCHEAGDVYSYMMKRFGMDYPTAVRELARKAGIVVPERTERAGPDPHEPLYGAVAAAQDWFARRLLESADASGARAYLERRDIPLEMAAPHGLGYAPAGGSFLEAMKALGVAERALVESGLAVQRDDGRVHARFRDRLLFPIHDLRGQPVGFGGRLLGPGEPKYLNSPETPIFHKGRQLYNLHQARPAVRQEQVVILVEGYFDVLRLVLAGIDHVVAPLGTALTPEQAALIKRVAPAAILLYDSDQAGLRATFRAGDELLRHGVRVRVATLPPGDDPDTIVQRGRREALEPLLRDALDVLERKVQLLDRRGWFSGVEHRREALDRLLPTVRAASDPITRDLYLALVAERSGVSREVLEGELKVGPLAPAEPARLPEPAAPRLRRRGTAGERTLLRLLLTQPGLAERARGEVDPAWFRDPAAREIFGVLARGMPPGDALVELGPEARDLAQELLDAADMPAAEVDALYAEALLDIEAQPLLVEYHRLRGRRTEEPVEAEQLAARRLSLKQELAARYPRQWKKYIMRTRSQARPGARVPRRSNAS
jgi:DNA primase